MDITSFVGIISGMSLIFYAIWSKGGLESFMDGPSFAVTAGGTIAATLINFPLSDVLGVIGVVKKVFLYKAETPLLTVQYIVDLSDKARREGVLAMEKEIENTEDQFLKKGIQLAVDGTESEQLREILQTDMDNIGVRHALGQSIFTAMGTYAPAFGMIGTLIGLVLMLRTMEDPSTIGPGMAVALVTTFYGALMANMIFLPIAEKLKTRSKQELLEKELIIEGLVAIGAGQNPRTIREILISFIPPKGRGEEATPAGD